MREHVFHRDNFYVYVCVCVVEDPNCARPKPSEVVKVKTDTAIPGTDVIINDNNTQQQVIGKRKGEEAREVVAKSAAIIPATEKRKTKVVTDVASENVPSNQQAEGKEEEDAEEGEKVPLLRVRSFAKPPTTWDDSSKQQKADKTATERSGPPKVVVQKKETNEIIDLTNETTSSSSSIKASSKYTFMLPPKCTIQKNKVLPVLKTQTVVIPAGSKNIINVQNITNNYLKLNPRTGQIIAGPDIRSIIVPTSVQTGGSGGSSPIQPQNVQNAGAIRYRIIQPRPTSAGKMTTAPQSATKQTDARPVSTGKSK